MPWVDLNVLCPDPSCPIMMYGGCLTIDRMAEGCHWGKLWITSYSLTSDYWYWLVCWLFCGFLSQYLCENMDRVWHYIKPDLCLLNVLGNICFVGYIFFHWHFIVDSHVLTHWNLGDVAEHFLWNHRQVNAITRPHGLSTLVSVKPWCCQTTNHYLNQCQISFRMPYGEWAQD